MTHMSEKAVKSPISWSTYVIKPMLVILGPLFFIWMMMTILMAIRADPTIMIALVLGGGAFAIALPITAVNKLNMELHGKKALVLTFREHPGENWVDYAVTKVIKPIDKKQLSKLIMLNLSEALIEASPEQLEQSVVAEVATGGEAVQLMSLASKTEGKSAVQTTEKRKVLLQKMLERYYTPYEIIFHEFERLTRMFLLSPCKEEGRLLIFKQDKIIYKGFPVDASTAPLDVVRLRWLEMENERVPIVVPKGCDFECEITQILAKTFAVDEKELDNVVAEIDSFRYLTLKQENITIRAENASLLKTINKLEASVEGRVGLLSRLDRQVDEDESEVASFFKGNWKFFWLGLGAVAVVVALVIVLW